LAEANGNGFLITGKNNLITKKVSQTIKKITSGFFQKPFSFAIQ
jgi:hypothetical protein